MRLWILNLRLQYNSFSFSRSKAPVFTALASSCGRCFFNSTGNTYSCALVLWIHIKSPTLSSFVRTIIPMVFMTSNSCGTSLGREPWLWLWLSCEFISITTPSLLSSLLKKIESSMEYSSSVKYWVSSSSLISRVVSPGSFSSLGCVRSSPSSSFSCLLSCFSSGAGATSETVCSKVAKPRRVVCRIAGGPDFDEKGGEDVEEETAVVS